MPQMKLSDVSVRSLPLPEKGQVTHWDAGLPGFGVRVSQGGTKTFIVIHGPTRKRYTIGRYGPITLKQARDEAKRLQAGLTLGVVENTISLTFNDAKELFLEACRTKNRPRTVYDYNRHLKRHFPFGRTRMSDITRADIQRRLNGLKDTPSERHHAYVTAKIFFNWAIQEELIASNPMGTMKSPSKLISRERFLSEDELKEVLRNAQTHPWPFGPIMQLLILTGQRRGEIGSLRWKWIDEKDQTITLPAEFTKNRQSHRFPYGDLAATLLKTLPRTSDYVFPARIEQATHFNGWGKCKARFDRALDGVGHYTLHDLRRTFSSNLAMLGAPIHVTEKLLNHKSGTISGVAAVYNRHSYLNEMREAIVEHDQFLGTLLDDRTSVA
ncbi:MAG: site-specific integrase [Rhodobacteraceae bacterium]|nr:site-specific integrase [Paracoccaceae bacterium]